jgi:hypothetical protein
VASMQLLLELYKMDIAECVRLRAEFHSLHPHPPVPLPPLFKTCPSSDFVRWLAISPAARLVPVVDVFAIAPFRPAETGRPLLSRPAMAVSSTAGGAGVGAGAFAAFAASALASSSSAASLSAASSSLGASWSLGVPVSLAGSVARYSPLTACVSDSADLLHGHPFVPSAGAGEAAGRRGNPRGETAAQILHRQRSQGLTGASVSGMSARQTQRTPAATASSRPGASAAGASAAGASAAARPRDLGVTAAAAALATIGGVAASSGSLTALLNGL